jgi:hypothetical protein
MRRRGDRNGEDDDDDDDDDDEDRENLTVFRFSLSFAGNQESDGYGVSSTGSSTKMRELRNG